MSDATSTAAGEPAGIPPHIGLGSAALIVIGTVIGSGIFFTSGIMLKYVPSAPGLVAVWVVGALLALAGGLVFAELGAMLPRSGGLYVYLGRAFGREIAFLYGWACLFVMLTGVIAGIAIAFAASVGHFLPLFAEGSTAGVHVLGLDLTAAQLLGAGAIVVLGAINYVNVYAGRWVSVVLTLLKIAGILALPALALLAPRVAPDWTWPTAAEWLQLAPGFGVAMIAAMWAYEGWHYVAFAAGEVRDAPRTLPRALVLGLGAVATIYVAVNLAYLHALPVDELARVTAVGATSAAALGGPLAAAAIAATAAISTLGTNAAMILVASRVFHAMARDGLFFPAAGRLHPRFGTPHVAVALTTAWSAVLALSGSYESIVNYVSFTAALFMGVGAVGLIVLRRREPELPRPFRVPGYPFTPLAFAICMAVLIANQLWQKPRESLLALAFVAVGLAFAAWWVRRRGAIAPVQGRASA